MFLPDKILTKGLFANIIKNTFIHYGRVYVIGKGGGKVSKPRGQNLFFVFAVLAFFFLLLSGGSRLIAAPQDGFEPILPAQSWLEASISCPPTSAVSEVYLSGSQESDNCAEQALVCDAKPDDFSPPQTDANGNILRHASYMRAVYQVFALGDGFA